MADLIRFNDSTELCLLMTLRHQSLARQLKLAEHAEVLEPWRLALQEASTSHSSSVQQGLFARDLEMVSRDDLLNAVRTLHDRCKQLDRESRRTRFQNILFAPDGKLMNVTAPKSSRTLSQSVNQLLERIAALGADQPFGLFVEQLSARLSTYHEAAQSRVDAENKTLAARDRELDARSNLCQRYEDNYYELAKELGKKNAEKLFPRFRVRSAKKEAPAPASQAPSTSLMLGNMTLSVQSHDVDTPTP